MSSTVARKTRDSALMMTGVIKKFFMLKCPVCKVKAHMHCSAVKEVSRHVAWGWCRTWVSSDRQVRPNSYKSIAFGFWRF
jgi:hypothetical protein